MITPNQIIEELGNIRTALNQLQIKGADNANYLLYSFQKCEFLIDSVTEVIKETQLNKELQNEGVEAGE